MHSSKKQYSVPTLVLDKVLSVQTDNLRVSICGLKTQHLFGRKWVCRFSRLNILGTLLTFTQKVTSCEVPNKTVKKNWTHSIMEPEPVIIPLTAYFFKENERRFSRRCKNGSRLNILGTLLTFTQKVTYCLLSKEKLTKNWLGSLTQSKCHVLCFYPQMETVHETTKLKYDQKLRLCKILVEDNIVRGRNVLFS